MFFSGMMCSSVELCVPQWSDVLYFSGVMCSSVE